MGNNELANAELRNAGSQALSDTELHELVDAERRNADSQELRDAELYDLVDDELCNASSQAFGLERVAIGLERFGSRRLSSFRSYHSLFEKLGVVAAQF